MDGMDNEARQFVHWCCLKYDCLSTGAHPPWVDDIGCNYAITAQVMFVPCYVRISGSIGFFGTKVPPFSNKVVCLHIMQGTQHPKLLSDILSTDSLAPQRLLWEAPVRPWAKGGKGVERDNIVCRRVYNGGDNVQELLIYLRFNEDKSKVLVCSFVSWQFRGRLK